MNRENIPADESPEQYERRRGLYQKYRVTRVDGTDAPGEKHSRCQYIVLDATHDRNAPPAIQAYADAVRADGYHALADDLDSLSFEASARLRPEPSAREWMDAEHAVRIRDAVAALNKAIESADSAGLEVQVDTHQMDLISRTSRTVHLSACVRRPIFPARP